MKPPVKSPFVTVSALSLLLVAAFAPASFARLGETLEKCQSRYGKVLNDKPDKVFKEFTKNGIAISAHFGKDGKCDAIFFTAYDSSIERRPFTETEIRDLITTNGQGKKLVKSQAGNGNILWEDPDDEMAMILVGKGSRLVVTTQEGRKALDKEMEKKAPTTEGF